jgi:hypothetical protein
MCYARQTANACAVWCWGTDLNSGKVALSGSMVCLCPNQTGTTNWN